MGETLQKLISRPTAHECDAILDFSDLTESIHADLRLCASSKQLEGYSPCSFSIKSATRSEMFLSKSFITSLMREERRGEEEE